MSASVHPPAHIARGPWREPEALPQSIEDERHVIGSVLIDHGTAMPLAVAAGLQVYHFADEAHRLAWAAIQRVAAAGLEVSPVSVFGDLQAHGHEERVGGLKYLSDLHREVDFPRAAGAHAAIVVERARRRQLVQHAETLRKAATGAGTEADLQRLVADVAAKLADGLEVATAPFRAVPVVDLSTMVVPAPTFAWAGLVPHGHVTVLTGHGGVGKSLVALMFTIACGTGRELFGIPTQRCRVAFFSGEDGADLLRHRLLWACNQMDVDPAELDGWVHILDATEGDPTLFAEMSMDGRRIGTTTSTYDALSSYLDEHSIDLMVVDNMSDVFDANEIERPKVRAFMRSLVRIRQGRRLTVLLLAHVDKGTARGERSGSESYSGSTALHNSARSRLFLSKDKDGALTLELQKHNLAVPLAPLKLEWPEGGLPRAEAPTNGYVQAIAATADMKALLRLIDEFSQRGEYVSPAVNSSSSAPRLLANERGYPKKRKATEVQAMLREAERDALLVREGYRGNDRHEKFRWVLTDAARVLIGSTAGSAGSAVIS